MCLTDGRYVCWVNAFQKNFVCSLAKNRENFNFKMNLSSTEAFRKGEQFE